VQIGLRPVKRWKGELKSEYRVQSAEYRVRSAEYRVQSTEYGVRSTDYGGEESVSAKVQIGLRPVERWKSELKVEDRVRSTEYREANKGDWLA
jgi:hypothetical protein